MTWTAAALLPLWVWAALLPGRGIGSSCPSERGASRAGLGKAAAGLPQSKGKGMESSGSPERGASRAGLGKAAAGLQQSKGREMGSSESFERGGSRAAAVQVELVREYGVFLGDRVILSPFGTGIAILFANPRSDFYKIRTLKLWTSAVRHLV